MPTNTSYGTEVREDGTQGRVMSKSCGDHDAVYREGDPVGDPFICTWQGEKVYILDKTMPPAKREFSLDGTGYTEFLGNSVFVGDGFMVGLVTTSSTLGQPATVAPLLMRMPHPGKVMTAAEFEAAEPAEKRKASILLPGIAIEHLALTYVIPMGWKSSAERFTFAVATTVATLLASDPTAVPHLWVGGTGGLIEARNDSGERAFGPLTPLSTPVVGLGVDWSRGVQGDPKGRWQRLEYFAHPYLAASQYNVHGWQSVMHSRLTCTGPGRLECVVVKSEPDNYTWMTTEGVSVPYRLLPRKYAWQAWPSGWPGPGGVTPEWSPDWPGNPSIAGCDPYPAFRMSVGFDLDIPSWCKTRQYAPRSPTTFILASDDFGATWNLSEASELEVTGYEAPVEPPVTGVDVYAPFRAAGGPAPNTEWFEASMPHGYTHIEVQSVDTVIQCGQIPFVTTSYRRELRRPSESIPFPAQTPRSNRGGVLRDPFESFTLVNAGASTFLVAPVRSRGPDEIRSSVSLGDWVDYLTGVLPQDSTHSYPTTEVVQTSKFEMGVFRRSGFGSFLRIPWPLDGVENEATNKLFTTEAKLAYNFTTPAVSWASTGQGKAAFFFIRANFFLAGPYAGMTPTSESVLMVATVDDGETWVTQEITNADLFYQTCVIASEGKGASIIYAMPAPEGKLQLMRISPDFTKVSKYGPVYSPGRGGLVNFQRYVHPGFPGLYEEPKETT